MQTIEYYIFETNSDSMTTIPNEYCLLNDYSFYNVDFSNAIYQIMECY